MKRIILIREYIIGLIIILLIVLMAYKNYLLIEEVLKRVSFRLYNYSFDITLYLVTLNISLAILVERYVIGYRIRNKNFEKIVSYGRLKKTILITYMCILHILFWLFIILNIEFQVSIILGASLGLYRILIVGRIFISDTEFIVRSKKYDIGNIKEIKDDFGSNFSLVTDKGSFSIFCGSLKGKNDLLSRLEPKIKYG